METINVKINFLHEARPLPHNCSRDCSNIVVSYPLGALPNRGDIIQIEGICHPEGAFFVSFRLFETQGSSLYACTLTLGVEGVPGC